MEMYVGDPGKSCMEDKSMKKKNIYDLCIA